MTEATDKMKELVDKIGRESKTPDVAYPTIPNVNSTSITTGGPVTEIGEAFPKSDNEELLATMMSDISQYAEALEEAYKDIKKPDNIIKVIGKLKGIIALIQTL